MGLKLCARFAPMQEGFLFISFQAVRDFEQERRTAWRRSSAEVLAARIHFH